MTVSTPPTANSVSVTGSGMGVTVTDPVWLMV